MYTGANAHGTPVLMKSEGRNDRLCSVADRGGSMGAMSPSDPLKDYLLSDLYNVAKRRRHFILKIILAPPLSEQDPLLMSGKGNLFLYSIEQQIDLIQ